MSVESFYDDGSSMVGAVGNATIAIMRGSIEEACIEAIIKAHRSVLTRHPSGVYSLTVVRSTTIFPGAAVQLVAGKAFHTVGKTMRASTVVLEGNGFWRSAAMSIITAIKLLGPSTIQRFEMSADLAEGLAKFRAAADESAGWQAEIARAVDALERPASAAHA